MAGTVPSSIETVTHFSLRTSPGGRTCYHPHVTDKDTERPEGLLTLSNDVQLVTTVGAGLCPQHPAPGCQGSAVLSAQGEASTLSAPLSASDKLGDGLACLMSGLVSGDRGWAC